MKGIILLLDFKGGEPTLIGPRYYKNFISYVEQQPKKVHAHYTIQTNGTRITEEWCEIFKEHNFLVGLSIDGWEATHNLYRLDTGGNGTYRRISQTKQLFDEYEIEYNVLSVLTKQISSEPKRYYDYLKNEGIDYIQIIPCLDSLEDEAGDEESEFALTPDLFAHFYNEIYRLWKRDLETGDYVSVKFIDDVFNLVHHRQVTSCGMLGQCVNQYIIEANGDVYPCDFYCLDEFKIGNILEDTLFDMRDTKTVRDFICFDREISPFCESCQFLKMCYGGCKRMKNAMYLNKEETYCGYQDFLKNNLDDIVELPKVLTTLGI